MDAVGDPCRVHPWQLIACSRVGSCSAIASSGTALSVETQSRGIWGRPEWVRLPSKATLGAVGLACPSPEGCLAIGSYTTHSGVRHALVVTDNSGVFTRARAPRALDFTGWPSWTLSAPWCARNGYCVIAFTVGTGSCDDAPCRWSVRTAKEVNGRWGLSEATPIALPNPAFPILTCHSWTRCIILAGGLYSVYSKGSWSDPNPTPNPLFDANTASCPRANECVVVGRYQGIARGDEPEAAAMTEADGRWGGLTTFSIACSSLNGTQAGRLGIRCSCMRENVMCSCGQSRSKLVRRRAFIVYDISHLLFTHN